jgi:hypothetical protein
MTGSDLIMLAPWILFGAALGAVSLRLLRSRRAPGPPGPPPAGPPEQPGRDERPEAEFPPRPRDGHSWPRRE